ncbi:hypothetical protein EYF80_047756 [Liparis tanakae]|uniref:Uncharacterized protein n=1 Tax=Liparis tanakae TaxID=230148 RepID=A0A4Z2FLG0_9TELE|nr:hypothetical protein EYF80_047756 [Liparis tanakae]
MLKSVVQGIKYSHRSSSKQGGHGGEMLAAQLEMMWMVYEISVPSLPPQQALCGMPCRHFCDGQTQSSPSRALFLGGSMLSCELIPMKPSPSAAY